MYLEGAQSLTFATWKNVRLAFASSEHHTLVLTLPSGEGLERSLLKRLSVPIQTSSSC